MSGHHSAGEMPVLKDNQLINVDTLKQKLDDVTVIDVRSAEEIAQSGRIGSKRWTNIPIKELPDALKMSPSEFQQKYLVSKPDENDEIVLHCAHGRRGGNATLQADSMGYSKAFNLVGGHSAFKQSFPDLSVEN